MIVRRVPPDDVPPDGDREVMVVVGQEGAMTSGALGSAVLVA